MSASAQIVRLHIVLEPAGLLRIVDRLVVLDLMPQRLSFRVRKSGAATLIVQLDSLDAARQENLIARLEQIPAVTSVRSSQG